jgi:hypothetical protein
MKRQHLILSAAALLMLSATPLFAASMGTSGGHDLDKLWTDAQRVFDTPHHDAIVLLESQHVTITSDGTKTTRVHRVVWISTARGIRDYADLRIPYNSATSTLSVVVLRTWRDDVWWPHESDVSETAVVETLPYAVALADDYTAMRETMLLHDGVEIPCIMETIYEIDERGAGTVGADGVWVFPQRDPAVLVELTLDVPADGPLMAHSWHGAPVRDLSRDADKRTYKWKMENVEPLGIPRIANPECYASYVSWSAWEKGDALGRKISSSFNEAAVVSDELAEALAKQIEHEPSLVSKARKIAAFINESTRSIHCDSDFWMFAPRPASRTWETAYGHGLDRAVLAAALFRQAGLEAEPVFHSASTCHPDSLLPGLSGYGSIMLSVRGNQFSATYDPDDGTLTIGPDAEYGHTFWEPGTNRSGWVLFPGATIQYELILTLEPGEDSKWNGTGFLNADGWFCPYGEMTGLGDEALDLLKDVASSVLPGATVNGFNPEVFERDQVTVGFEMELDPFESDDLDRLSVHIGDPSGGIIDQLPSDVHLYDEGRGSPVVLPGAMTQRVVLRLKTGEREVVQLPEAVEIKNEVGSFTVTAQEKDGWLTVTRELSLNTATVRPEAWPDLRALLLDETDSGNRTILMK